MKVTYVPCGPAVNESETKAIEHLRSRLQSVAGGGEWILLTNLAFSVNSQLQSDEIDVVVIGPPGVRMLEIKHWNVSWMQNQPWIVENEAEKVTRKARKLGTALRKTVPSLPLVDGGFLLTREPYEANPSMETVRGVMVWNLSEWRETLNINGSAILSDVEIRKLAVALEPRSGVALDGTIRRFGGYTNLEILTPREERFHRVYRGVQSIRQDRVILHLYDLSASNDKNPERKARREFETLRILQAFSWAPRVLDSFQEASGYPGELFFFTVVDPAAPTLEERAQDISWTAVQRIDFARKTVRALSEMHSTGPTGMSPVVHRNISPRTILVKHDSTPIFTGFEIAKIPADFSIASTPVAFGDWQSVISPEVKNQGLAAADYRSDIYSLCASLRILFEAQLEEIASNTKSVLNKGVVERPEDRCTLEDLDRGLSEVLGESVVKAPIPAARFWTEDQVVPFRDRNYRIVTRLGAGGIGATFKVVELSRTNEELGTYVAKVVHLPDNGKKVLRAYSLVRSHLGRHPSLSVIYEVATQWYENDFVALMTWIEGVPLAEFAGVFSLLAEDAGEINQDILAARWLQDLCAALETLHHNGLIHGDVSPKNIIVSGGEIVLTDYDFVTRIDEPIVGPATLLYCSPSYQERRTASASDDLYALAASFFHVLFERDPFQHGGCRSKERGLNWDGINREEHQLLAQFLDKATNPNPDLRFKSAGEARSMLQTLTGYSKAERAKPEGEKTALTEISGLLQGGDGASLSEETKNEGVEWLLSLLQSYPGSRWGNFETRGLDTPFAAQTYVETGLEEILLGAITKRKTRLVVLCGNAGDGKTALLQHLAAKLGFGDHKSAERILEHQLEDGLTVRMNLDGSAAWKGRSADAILDDFLSPFQYGIPSEDIAHLLAVNDGRLLEWIESAESRSSEGSTPLTEQLYSLLQQGSGASDSHIRFISLNERSLVGGITVDGKEIQTKFLEELIDHLYGGSKAHEIWKPCLSCSANSRCEVVRALRVFGPANVSSAVAENIRARARQRLFEALQAVHLRGEIHITARELRATLIFILFGLHSCSDYRNVLDMPPLPYWDLAFDPAAPGRQGDLLRELVLFDPALEAHPQIDRYLLAEMTSEGEDGPPRYGSPLVSARRRAYFEWTEDQTIQVARSGEALGLARGRHLKLFRQIALNGVEGHNEEVGLVCARLCSGISRLEDLPPQALDRLSVVPLRITPRTPIETSFWVEKSLSAFRIEAQLTNPTEGIDRLHRQARLVYSYRDGQEDTLYIGAELFHMLLELSEGYQLGDVSTDDTFAHLSIFVRRLAREDERRIFAWNPMQDETIFEITTRMDHGNEFPVQELVLNSLREGGHA